MIRWVVIVLAVGQAGCLLAYAQTVDLPEATAPRISETGASEQADAGQEENAELGEAAPTAEPPAPTEPPGDTITLKSGGVLQGFQIRRTTPTYYEVEIVPGTVTLRLLRRQVESVVYDDFDPIRDRPYEPPARPIPGPSLVTVSEELDRRLNADISEPPLNFVQEDVVAVLDKISQRADVPIRVDESVAVLPPAERTWSFQVTPGATARQVLNSLAEQFERLEIIYQEDGVLVSAKTLEQALPEGQEPSAPEAVPAAAPPSGPPP